MPHAVLKSRWLWPGCGLLLVLCLLAMLFGPLWYEMHIARRTIAMIDGRDSVNHMVSTQYFSPSWMPASITDWTNRRWPDLFKRVTLVMMADPASNQEADFQLVCRNPRLEVLNWVSHQNTDDTLRQLSRLRDLKEIFLAHGEISTPGLALLNNTANLDLLSLSNLRLRLDNSGEKIQFNHLRSLILISVSYSSCPLNSFKSCGSLKALSVNNSPWHVRASQPLGALRSLVRCAVLNGELTNAMLEDFVALPSLKELKLSDCQFQPDQLTILAGSTTLRKLRIINSKVDDQFVDALGKLTQLDVLDIEHANISAEGVQQLQERLPACTIDAIKPEPLWLFR